MTHLLHFEVYRQPQLRMDADTMVHDGSIGFPAQLGSWVRCEQAKTRGTNLAVLLPGWYMPSYSIKGDSVYSSWLRKGLSCRIKDAAASLIVQDRRCDPLSVGCL